MDRTNILDNRKDIRRRAESSSWTQNRLPCQSEGYRSNRSALSISSTVSYRDSVTTSKSNSYSILSDTAMELQSLIHQFQEQGRALDKLELKIKQNLAEEHRRLHELVRTRLLEYVLSWVPAYFASTWHCTTPTYLLHSICSKEDHKFNPAFVQLNDWLKQDALASYVDLYSCLMNKQVFDGISRVEYTALGSSRLYDDHALPLGTFAIESCLDLIQEKNNLLLLMEPTIRNLNVPWWLLRHWVKQQEAGLSARAAFDCIKTDLRIRQPDKNKLVYLLHKLVLLEQQISLQLFYHARVTKIPICKLREGFRVILVCASAPRQLRKLLKTPYGRRTFPNLYTLYEMRTFRVCALYN